MYCYCKALCGGVAMLTPSEWEVAAEEVSLFNSVSHKKE